MSDYLLNTYQPLPVCFSHGEGAWLWDEDNHQYLDALGGIAVCGLGHAHPDITKAIQTQAQQLLHTSNYYQISNQQHLAQQIAQYSGMSESFFANSGAEANEAAMKICRLFGHKKAIEHPHVIVMEKAFHGRTLAMLSASGSRKVQAGFEPLVQGYIRAPYNDIDAIETILQNRHDVVAIFLEPIQGEGGINLPSAGYLQSVRQLCDRYDCLMVLDEVQSGIARTGKFFAYQHENILPDIVTSAKALGNGIPIGACIAAGKALNLLQPGNHGTTFGGSPFATKVASTVLDVIERDSLCDASHQLGQFILEGLTDSLQNFQCVNEVRGKGLMIGIELNRPCLALAKIGLKERILFNIASSQVVRLLPPYILDREQAQLIIDKITSCISQFTQ